MTRINDVSGLVVTEGENAQLQSQSQLNLVDEPDMGGDSNFETAQRMHLL